MFLFKEKKNEHIWLKKFLNIIKDLSFCWLLNIMLSVDYLFSLRTFNVVKIFNYKTLVLNYIKRFITSRPTNINLVMFCFLNTLLPSSFILNLNQICTSQTETNL